MAPTPNVPAPVDAIVPKLEESAFKFDEFGAKSVPTSIDAAVEVPSPLPEVVGVAKLSKTGSESLAKLAPSKELVCREFELFVKFDVLVLEDAAFENPALNSFKLLRKDSPALLMACAVES